MEQFNVNLKIGKPDLPASFGQEDPARQDQRGDFAKFLTADAAEKAPRPVHKTAQDHDRGQRDDVQKASREILHQTNRHDAHDHGKTHKVKARKNNEEETDAPSAAPPTKESRQTADSKAKTGAPKPVEEKICEDKPIQQDAVNDQVANDNIVIAADQTQDASLILGAPVLRVTPEENQVDISIDINIAEVADLLGLPQPANDNEKAALTEFLKPVLAVLQQTQDASPPERFAALADAFKAQLQLVAQNDKQAQGILQSLPPQKLDQIARQFAETLLAVEPKLVGLNAAPVKEEKTPATAQVKTSAQGAIELPEAAKEKPAPPMPAHLLRQVLERLADLPAAQPHQRAHETAAQHHVLAVNPDQPQETAPQAFFPQNQNQAGMPAQNAQTIAQTSAPPHFTLHARMAVESDTRGLAGVHQDFAGTQILGEGGRTVNSYDAASQLSALRATRGGATGLPPAVEQVALQIHRNARQGIDQMSLQLRPAELGRIDIKLHFADGNVRGMVVADNAATLEMLMKDARSIERALQEAGFNADQGCLEFSLRGDGAHRDAETGKQDKKDEAFSLDGAEQTVEQQVEDGEIYYITPGRVNLRV